MKKKGLVTLLVCLIFSSSFCLAQNQILYKQIDTTKLYLDIRYPDNFNKKNDYPAMVFFFGGGWEGGNIKQFEPQAKYFSGRGLICILVDYRVKSRQQTTPFESLKDAKSAIRYIRIHARELGVDPNRVVASGGSAGGHLAAATALITAFDENTDDLSVSCVPNALVLFNPVIDNGPGGYGYDRIGERYKDFSPLHNLQKGAPPTIFFLGTKDTLVPVETAEYYKNVMNKIGSRCDLKLFEGESHGFFNYKRFENYRKTVLEADEFLQSLGYLKKDPYVDISH
jgi:acetyl esterase/lipase